MSRKFVKLLSILTVLWMAPNGRAQAVHQANLKIQGSFILQQDDLTSLINQMTQSWLTPGQTLIQDLQLTTPYHSEIHNVTWNGTLSTEWQKKSGAPVWQFQLQVGSPVLSIASVSVHDTLVENINGVILHVAVDGSCQNLQVQLPGYWQAQGDVAAGWAGSKLGLQLQSFNFSSSSEAPRISVGSCQGPAGLDKAIADSLTAFLSDPNQLRNWFASELSQLLTQKASDLQAQLMKPLSWQLTKDIQFLWTPSQISASPEGNWIFDGNFQLSDANATQDYSQMVLRKYTDESIQDSRESGFIFPYAAINPLVGFLQSAGLFHQRFSSSQFPSMGSLLNSRFVQFFLWPDLWNFPLNSEFQFDVSTAKAPYVQSVSNNFFGGITLGLQPQLRAVMLAQVPTASGSSYLPYVDFTSTPDVNLQISADQGRLNLTAGASTVPLQYQWDPVYQLYRSTSSWISTGELASSLQSALSGVNWQWSIPEDQQVLPGFQIQFSNVLADPQTFRVEITLQKK